MYQSEKGQMKEFVVLNLQTARNVVLRRVKQVTKYEATCYKVQGFLDNPPFQDYPFLGDTWMTISYIKGSSLLYQMVHSPSASYTEHLKTSALFALHSFHRKGYYHGNPLVEHFIVHQTTQQVFLMHYQDCGPMLTEPITPSWMFPLLPEAIQDVTVFLQDFEQYCGDN